MPEEIIPQEIFEKEKQYHVGTYPRLPFVLTEGRGSYLYDSEGQAYLDFGAGIAVNALGHCDPQLVAAIQKQAAALSHVSNLYNTVPQTLLAEKLCQLSFADKVFFGNSGAEAVEASLKFARKYARQKYGEGKTKFVAFTQGFHGRTFGALSVTAREKYQKPFLPLLADVEVVPFNDVEAAKNAIDDQTCAVIVEPVQGEGGIHPASKEFMAALREACDAHHALLIVDEIQTGVGRTGKLWAYQHFDIQPDMMTVAKALGGGLPIGAVLLTDEVASVLVPGDHGSTFGGGPVAASAALVVLERLQAPSMLAHVAEMGAYLKEQLLALELPHIQEVRALGLMVGVEMNVEAGPLYQAAHEYGILILTAGPTTVRLLPPLIISKTEIDQFILAFKQLIMEKSA